MPGNGRGENDNIVGAVMVVGGGIAGMQASLDLAESGYKVYLVEKKSAIGGHMAQLDKTFPTNDCAMCTISPKLVETAAHLNIELLTDSELTGLAGEPGHFTATVRTNPRYIDVTKCTGCGECADVCPVIIPGRFDEGLAQQHAAHKLYPQAAPNAYAIEKRGIAPCRDACPAHQRAQGYIALIREGRYHDALRVIKEDNPFPGICGRICNHRCEEACNRNLVDDPINIHALKRFVTDRVYAEERVPPEPCEVKYDQRVAIIGSGGIGFDVAEFLTHQGETGLDAYLEEWGVDREYAERGAVKPPARQASPRQVTLLQRTAGKPGAKLGKTTGWIHRMALVNRGVTMLPGVSYERIDASGVHVTVRGKPKLIEADTVVICAGQVEETSLVEPLRELGKTPMIIGGAKFAGELDAMRAIAEGTDAVLAL